MSFFSKVSFLEDNEIVVSKNKTNLFFFSFTRNLAMGSLPQPTRRSPFQVFVDTWKDGVTSKHITEKERADTIRIAWGEMSKSEKSIYKKSALGHQPVDKSQRIFQI